MVPTDSINGVIYRTEVNNKTNIEHKRVNGNGHMGSRGRQVVVSHLESNPIL